MRKRSIRVIALVAALGILAATVAGARPSGDGPPHVCGANAIPLPPVAAFDSSRIEARTRPARATPVVGERELLYIYNYTRGGNDQLWFTYEYVGPKCAIMVADLQASRISDAEISRLARIFEENAGPGAGIGTSIYQKLSDTYMPPDAVFGDSRVYIALSEIQSDLAGGYIAGYVSASDRASKRYYSASNERHLIVLDAVRAPASQREETLAHEFYHVIQNRIQSTEQSWLNEGLAVFSQTLCGYPGNDGASYFVEPATALTADANVLSLAQYDMAYMIMQYLADRYGGSSLIGDIARSLSIGVTSIDNALAARGRSERFANDVFPAWAIANLTYPGSHPVYSYASFNPLDHQPGNFGGTGALPITRNNTRLSPYSVNYFRTGDSGAEGEIVTVSGGKWGVNSAEIIAGVTPAIRAIRAWSATNSSAYRDCGTKRTWLTITCGGATGTYSLSWRSHAGTVAKLVSRVPATADVPAWQSEISATFENIDPAANVSASIVSQRLGVLARDVRIEWATVPGRCGMSLTVIDRTGTPLPANDLITVQIGDLPGVFGGALASSSASWQFRTGASDTEPPHVTVGLLANPVLRDRLTAMVIADEPLAAGTDGTPVRIIVNGSSTVDLAAIDAAHRQWTGSFALPASGRCEIIVRASDPAGNAVAVTPNAWAVVVERGGASARARIARIARIAPIADNGAEAGR